MRKPFNRKKFLGSKHPVDQAVTEMLNDMGIAETRLKCPTLKKKFHVPIFDVRVTVTVTDDIPAAYKRQFGVDIGDTRMACLGYHGNRFGLFLEPRATARIEIVAHEVFHLTHRILERCCMNFDEQHHEQGAYLNEWLTKRVHDILRRHAKGKAKKKG